MIIKKSCKSEFEDLRLKRYFSPMFNFHRKLFLAKDTPTLLCTAAAAAAATSAVLSSTKSRLRSL